MLNIIYRMLPCKRHINSKVYRLFGTSKIMNGLDEFFDVKENWGQTSASSGRPWRLDELRIKSNEDLHNLWYVLLKERNMLMTMEEEHMRNHYNLPNSERFEKVEESMENLLQVVEERDHAVTSLEHGVVDGPDETYKIDKIGREVYTVKEEYLEPRDRMEDSEMFGQWTVDLLRKIREKENANKKDDEFWDKYNEELIKYDEEYIKKIKH